MQFTKHVFILLFVFAIFLFSCAKKEESVKEDLIRYIDGTYTATASIKDDWGGSAEVEIVVKDGRITSCIFSSYEEKKQKYKNDIQVLANEIIELKKKKLESQKRGDYAEASYLGEQINAKTSFLTEFSKAKNDELATIKQSLTNDDKFYSSIYEVITKIAVRNGYSMVLSLQDGGAILWYSPTVDITEDVITELRKN